MTTRLCLAIMRPRKSLIPFITSRKREAAWTTSDACTSRITRSRIAWTFWANRFQFQSSSIEKESLLLKHTSRTSLFWAADTITKAYVASKIYVIWLRRIYLFKVYQIMWRQFHALKGRSNTIKTIIHMGWIAKPGFSCRRPRWWRLIEPLKIPLFKSLKGKIRRSWLRLKRHIIQWSMHLSRAKV